MMNLYLLCGLWDDAFGMFLYVMDSRVRIITWKLFICDWIFEGDVPFSTFLDISVLIHVSHACRCTLCSPYNRISPSSWVNLWMTCLSYYVEKLFIPHTHTAWLQVWHLWQNTDNIPKRSTMGHQLCVAFTPQVYNIISNVEASGAIKITFRAFSKSLWVNNNEVPSRYPWNSQICALWAL